MRRIAATATVAVALAACAPAVDRQAEGATPTRTAAAQPPSAPSPPARVSQITPLDPCPVLRKNDEEMPFVEVNCAGAGGWSLRIADSDARQQLTLVAPGGPATPLDTGSVDRGAFSSFGSAAEWRGPAGGAPDAVIVRYQFARDPHPAPEVSYLLVVRLAAEPCLAGAIEPGPDQTAQARRAADGALTCDPR